MHIVKPSFEILTDISPNAEEELSLIERAARTCYKSEDKMTGLDSAKDFIKRITIGKNHTSVLEHSILSIKFIVNRGVSHELVRHRHAGYSQESTRYCNYMNEKFGRDIAFIMPINLTTDKYDIELGRGVSYNPSLCVWQKACEQAEDSYFELITLGVRPEDARSVLPISVKTEIVVTASYREWREIFRLRCAKDAHPDMQYIMKQTLEEVVSRIPVIFDDILETVKKGDTNGTDESNDQ